MGEIADMMIEGDLCEACGMALDGEGYGIPRYCSNECARDRGYAGIAPDGAGTYNKSGKNKQKPVQPQDTISIKITYNGVKVLQVVEHDNTFDNAIDIAEYLTKYLTQALEIKPKFLHPKVKDSQKGENDG